MNMNIERIRFRLGFALLKLTLAVMPSHIARELVEIMRQGLPGVIERASAELAALDSMPWCERCECYHHDTAEHIKRAAQ